jgi:hypothetical protein
LGISSTQYIFYIGKILYKNSPLHHRDITPIEKEPS